MSIETIIQEISKAHKIAIMPHISVDGDGLGSSLALAKALTKVGKSADIFIEDEIPGIYSFLPGTSEIKRYVYSNYKYDLTIALDSGDIQRLGNRVDIFKDSQVTINIDHHITNTGFAEYNLVDANASSTGEMMFRLITMMNIAIDRDMAQCIYTAIAADTGGFRYSNTTPYTHEAASHLLGYDIDVADISRRIFETSSFERVKLTGIAIQAIQLHHDGKVALVIIDKQMIKNAGARDEDCEGIVNVGRSIKGVEVSVVLRQINDNDVKVNFRSNEYADVASISRMYGGGGHKRAAGCITKGPLLKLKDNLLEDLKDIL